MSKWHVSVCAETRVGAWCEDHHRHVTVYGIQVTSGYGDRWYYIGPMELESEVQALHAAGLIADHAARVPTWSPAERPDCWVPGAPVYGSTAYEQQYEACEGELRALDDVEPDERLRYMD
jgi:hypothetical protein